VGCGGSELSGAAPVRAAVLRHKAWRRPRVIGRGHVTIFAGGREAAPRAAHWRGAHRAQGAHLAVVGARRARHTGAARGAPIARWSMRVARGTRTRRADRAVVDARRARRDRSGAGRSWAARQGPRLRAILRSLAG